MSQKKTDKYKNTISKQDTLITILKNLSNSIAIIILINILLTFVRKIASEKIGVTFSYEWVWWGVYSSIGLLCLCAFIFYIIISLPIIKFRVKPLTTTFDYLVSVFTIGIISNYFLIGGPVTFWSGSMLSNLFDILLIFSLVLFFYFFVGSIIRLIPKLSQDKIPNAHHEYNSGNPIETKDEDKLNRSDFANKLGEALENQQQNESLTIGLLGGWGSGKSSVYNMVKEYSSNLKIESGEESNILYIDFKPWYFGKDNHDIIRIYLFHFLEEIKKTRGYNPKIGKVIKQYADIISTVSVRSFGTIVSFKEMIDKFLPTRENVSLTELKKEIENLLLKFPKRIVVYIDDIDRLEGNEIRMMFKLVRLIADFPRVTYIMALDEEIVKKSLASIYQVDADSNFEDAKKYIEKFIQIPIYLPKPDNNDLETFFSEQIRDVIEKNNIEGANDIQIVKSLIDLKYSPRNIYRYKNLVQFYLPLLKSEVNINDLLYLIMIQVSSSDLYNFIYHNKKVLINEESTFTEGDRNKLNNIENINEYRDILETLFPSIVRLFGEELKKFKSSEKILWEKNKRICSYKFFDQYFVYGVPTNKISQTELTDLITLLRDGGLSEVKKGYINLIEKFSAAELNSKLGLRIEEISGPHQEKLLHILKDIYHLKYRKNTKFEGIDSILSLAKTIARNLHFENHVFDLQFWEDGNILFTIGIHNYLKQTNINKNELSVLKKAVQRAYINISDECFFINFNQSDAYTLWLNWNHYFSDDEIKLMVNNWIKSDDDFENILNFTFNNKHSGLLKNEEILIGLFINSTRYLTDEKIESYFKNKCFPSTEYELDEYITKTNYRNVGTFILAKNKLFKFIIEQLEEIFTLSVSQHILAQPKSYIHMGAELIIKFGNENQRLKIEENLKIIGDYNQEYIKEREAIEEAQRDLQLG
ncbi:P-loop NTPase fold protein [Neobacillus rhizosphaerae]|uniref:KAP family P-loop NTPase fold protein n=1 Tax=Neobacillus rhizosphaerae TaxID=2880965 RepID=UPI003D269798